MSSSSNRSERARADNGAAGVRDRLGGLFAKAATRASEGAGRLREAAGAGLRPSILQHAHAARERGNLEAAFWLLEEAFRAGPEDRETAAALWEVACSLDRAPAAAAAGIALVEASAAQGQPDVAARYFAALTEGVPEARVSPAAVARMLPPLCARVAVATEPEAGSARRLARLALSHALHGSETGEGALTPGLAVHLFKEARDIDPAAARRTAEIALTSPNLHEVKRAELERFLASPDALEVDPDDSQPELEVDPDDSQSRLEVDPDDSQAVPAAGPDAARSQARAEADPEADPEADSETDPEADLETDPDAPPPALEADGEPSDDEEPVLPPLSQEEVVDAARRLVDRHGPLSTEPPPAPVTDGLKILRAVPVAFEEQALLLRLPGGRDSRVGWKEIQALSVAEIAGGSGGTQVVIDCILNWRRRNREPLRLVRLYASDFAPDDFVDSQGADLATFLTDLFERCQAAPLPDPESALGVRIAAFDDLESYQREVLQV